VNVLAFYHDLKKRGVLLDADGEMLRVDAPAGELTDEDRAALAEFKPLLMRFIAGRPLDDGRRFEARPSRHPSYTSLYDPASDEWHDFPTRDCFPSIVEEANGHREQEGAAEHRPDERRKQPKEAYGADEE
jgi:TubC N-terminal docking domain